jgi:drug/metabolite transporter (DMT)-like permease
VRPIDRIAVGGLLLCCAIWGVNQVAIKIVNDWIPPLLQAGIRSVLSGALIWLWAQMRGIALFGRDGTLWPGVAAGALFAGNFICVGPGLSLTDASRGVLFLYAAPFFVAIGAHLLIPGERLTLAKVAGLILAFAGLVVMVGDRLSDGSSGASLIGDALCLAAGFFWACTTLVIRATALRTVSAEKSLFYQLAVSAPILFAGSMVVAEPAIGRMPPDIVAWFAYTVVVVVFFSYVLWFWILKTYPAAEVSAFTFLGPIFAVAAGHLILGEAVTWRHGAALALIALGLWIINRPTHHGTGRR